MDGTRDAERLGARKPFGLKHWKSKEERILEPVLALRVIREVSVMGCVSDEWAKYLEENLKEEEKEW
jgi:hypothetical protein